MCFPPSSAASANPLHSSIRQDVAQLSQHESVDGREGDLGPSGSAQLQFRLRVYTSRGPAHPENALAALKEDRRTERLLKTFPGYPDDRELSGRDADAVLWAIAGRVDEEADLEELKLPGVRESAGLYGASNIRATVPSCSRL